MIIKSNDRVASERANLKGGLGSLVFSDLTTQESKPAKLRLCSEMLIKPGCSIGEHKHIAETEIYYCLAGKGQVMDDGRFVDFTVGDNAITDGIAPHSIINNSSEDLRIIAFIVMN